MNFYFRNTTYCTKNPRKSYAVTRAMKCFRLKNPRCSFCDWDKGTCHVHHIEPIKYAPDRAGDPLNFITLCPKCHHVVGHGRNWKQYVENVSQLCEAAKIVGDMHLTE